jgi:uncharacterized protein
MKQIFLIIFFFFAASCVCFAQNSTSTYDSALARKLGADDYGMKKYVFAFLKSGKTIISDKTEEQKIQIAHLRNIQRLAADGKLVIAGPFMDNQELRGIFIFNLATIEEAKQLIETDPAIKAGVLVMELHPWYGSAALMEVVGIHHRLEKKNITD